MKKNVTVLLICNLLMAACSQTTNVPVKPVPAMGRIDATYFIYGHEQLDLNRDGRLNMADKQLAEETMKALDGLIKEEIPARHMKEFEVYSLMRQLAGGKKIELSAEEARQVRWRLQIIGRICAMAEKAASHGVRSAPVADEPAQLDFKLYADNNVQPFFLTDLDSTAWEGDLSTFFLSYMLHKVELRLPDNSLIMRQIDKVLAKQENEQELRKMSNHDLLVWALDTYLNGGPVNGLQLFNLVCAATYGFTRAELEAMVVDFFDNGYDQTESGRPFKEHLYGEMALIYRDLQAKGASGWAITAGLDFWAQEGAYRLGLPREHLRASVLAFDEEGRSLGYCKRNIFSIKDEEVLDIAEKLNGLPMAAYGDSIHSDTPMFLWADVVNRILDEENKAQLALAPEFRSRSLENVRTPQLVEELNKEFGTNFEFHAKPSFEPRDILK